MISVAAMAGRPTAPCHRCLSSACTKCGAAEERVVHAPGTPSFVPSRLPFTEGFVSAAAGSGGSRGPQLQRAARPRSCPVPGRPHPQLIDLGQWGELPGPTAGPLRLGRASCRAPWDQPRCWACMAPCLFPLPRPAPSPTRPSIPPDLRCPGPFSLNILHTNFSEPASRGTQPATLFPTKLRSQGQSGSILRCVQGPGQNAHTLVAAPTSR